MKIADNIKELRKINKLSQEKLAEKVGVSRQSVSKWENGEAYPEMANILALCSIFHCKVTDIVDVNSTELKKMDKETSRSLMEFEKKDRKRLKVVSKIVYVMAKIMKYLTLLFFVAMFVINYYMRDVYWNAIFSDLPNYYAEENITLVSFFQYGGFAKTILVIGIIVLYLATMFYAFKLFLEIERLFKRISSFESPFTIENIFSLKRIAIYIILGLILPGAAKLLTKILMPDVYSFNIDLPKIFYTLIAVTLVYVFRYGLLLQRKQEK